ncbi:MAG TPA: hypothetical protein PLW81_08085 [Thiobacillaceae bacterium]|nr:hypothetical protein [Thiobacillaceae bacterium]
MDTTPQNLTLPPSTAARPDLDWSQVRETILMLNLAVAQIELALRDSGGSVEVLTDSFTGMYGNIMALVEATLDLPDSPVKETLHEAGRSVSMQMQHAIVAFQFYDRLSQRLSHVCRSLEQLTGIVNDPGQLYSPFAWHALQQKIRSKYTMEDEKLMFDTLLETGNVQEALERYVQKKQQEANKDPDIELF